MKIDINKLRKLEKDGWLMSQVHPTLPLIIWNYTNQTQWEGYWNEFTLMCRALVTDTEGEVVAHPMKKFFNYSELLAKGQVPFDDFFTVYKKMDGSLIQLFYYKDTWVISSRGSFTSDHANYAFEIIVDQYPQFVDLNQNCNYIFELIHPDTRIVIDYGDTKDLILLAVIDKEGNEKNINEYIDVFTLVEEFNVNFNPSGDWEFLEDFIQDNEEGFVIKFSSGTRMKIKGEEYCRLHKIVTQTSSYDIWETLKDNKDITELIERAPDEWLTWVFKTIGEIYVEFKKIQQQVERDWEYGIEKGLYAWCSVENEWANTINSSRRQIAEYFYTCQYPALMFNKLDGMEYDQKIWEMCKPKHSKAFSI